MSTIVTKLNLEIFIKHMVHTWFCSGRFNFIFQVVYLIHPYHSHGELQRLQLCHFQFFLLFYCHIFGQRMTSLIKQTNLSNEVSLFMAWKWLKKSNSFDLSAVSALKDCWTIRSFWSLLTQVSFLFCVGSPWNSERLWAEVLLCGPQQRHR